MKKQRWGDTRATGYHAAKTIRKTETTLRGWGVAKSKTGLRRRTLFRVCEISTLQEFILDMHIVQVDGLSLRNLKVCAMF